MVTGHGNKRGRVEAFVAAMLEEPTIEAAAKRAGIGRRTGQKWLQDPDVRKLYDETRRQLLDHTLVGLQRISGRAVSALDEGLGSGNRTADRIRAANVALTHLLRLRELVDLEERLAVLERRMAESPTA